VLLIAGVAAANQVTDFFGEVFGTQTYEQAPYQVMATFEDGAIEERFYPSKNWVCKTSTQSPGEDNSNGNFMSLFRYIQGSNAADQTIDMTIPVSVKKTPAANGEDSDMSMCFFLGEAHQSNPPQPKDLPGVFMSNRPDMTVYVSEFGWWPSDAEWQRQSDQLKEKLSSLGKTWVPDVEYRVSYQSPMRIVSRKQEIWLVKA